MDRCAEEHRMKRTIGHLAALCCILHPAPARALSPWPAEANTSAVLLTGADPEFDAVNMSGACWNPATRTLWLANNFGRFHALTEDAAGGFMVATNAAGTKARWAPGGDLEGICQVDYGEQVVYLMDENSSIRAYDVSNYGVVNQTRSWNITAQCPEVGGAGPEGITFVPDEWLSRQGFRSAGGALYTSTNGMGGLMFVGHQTGGYVHVFDLVPSGTTYGYVGQYKTSRAETAGLEFDRTTGKLYLWHNTGGNFLEVAELNSYVDGPDRRLRTIEEYAGPRSGNLEGFACAPTQETNNWCFVTDDANLNSEALVWYRHFEPSEDTDADVLPDGWELWYFGTTTQTVGAADSDLDGWNNTDEYVADTDPADAGSFFPPLQVRRTVANLLLTMDATSTNRTYHIDSRTNLMNEAWQPWTNAIGTGAAWSLPLPEAGDRHFFRSRVTLPPP
jgi:hypothetical protein